MLDESVRERAITALEHHAWREAYDLLAPAEARGELTPADLETLAQAAWWTGQLPVAIDVRERAYSAATKAGDVETAVQAAINLGTDNRFRELGRRTLTLKGIPDPVEVASITWN